MTNPLAKYYRVPGISVTVPSKGKFQPEGNIEHTITGEVEVHPMKAADELLLKSPDALISGRALESMIESCVPGVKDVRALPHNDVDALLVAIRAATYGNSLEITDQCPACSIEQTFEIDIAAMLGRMTFLEGEYPVEFDGMMTAYLRPLTFAENVAVSKRMFEETRFMQHAISREGITEDQKHAAAASAYQRMHALNISIVAQSIARIVTPDGITTDFDHICEFVENAPMQWFKQLEKGVGDITTIGVNKTAVVQCGKCDHEWDTDIVFDPASFFKLGS